MSIHGLQEIVMESISAVTATNSVDIGTERWVNGVKYRYMYNSGTTASATLIVTCTGSSGFTCTVSSITGSPIAGVVVHTDIPSTYYGWIATQGFVTMLSDGNSNVVEGSKVVAAYNGQVMATGDDSTSSGWSGLQAGGAYSVETLATSATFKGFVNVM